MRNEDDSIIDELDSRLDDFFSEDEETVKIDKSEAESVKAQAESAPEESSASDDIPIIETEEISDVAPAARKHKNESPLNDLKAIVLEMDWEISDENLSNYINEISRLMNIYSNDRVLYLFFKLHNSIGKYLISKKAAAHPDSIRFLHSVFSSLEKVIITPNLAEEEKNKLILTEVNNFKALKSQILPSKQSARAEVPSRAKVNQESAQQLSQVMSEIPESLRIEIQKFIKSTVKMEMDALRKELLKSS